MMTFDTTTTVELMVEAHERTDADIDNRTSVLLSDLAVELERLLTVIEAMEAG